MTGSELLAGLLGIIAPAVNALFKRLGLSEKVQSIVILCFLIVIAGAMAIGSGEISLSACSGLGLEQCVGMIYKYVGLVLTAAFVSYKMFWQALGIDDKIAGA